MINLTPQTFWGRTEKEGNRSERKWTFHPRNISSKKENTFCFRHTCYMELAVPLHAANYIKPPPTERQRERCYRKAEPSGCLRNDWLAERGEGGRGGCLSWVGATLSSRVPVTTQAMCWGPTVGETDRHTEVETDTNTEGVGEKEVLQNNCAHCQLWCGVFGFLEWTFKWAAFLFMGSN